MAEVGPEVGAERVLHVQCPGLVAPRREVLDRQPRVRRHRVPHDAQQRRGLELDRHRPTGTAAITATNGPRSGTALIAVCPDLALGEKVFQQDCAACHGKDGRAQVAIAATMEPQPANFHDPDTMAGLTPYKAFNTVGFGVPGTPMPGFPTLSEEERWAVSFYLFTLRLVPAAE